MSDNHLTDRQRESSKYIIATNQGESIIYTNEMKDDEQFHEEDQLNPVSELQTNDVEYEDEYQPTNNRNRSNSFDKKKIKSKQNVQYYQQHQNKQNRNVKKHQREGYYYQQTDPNEDFEYYAEENEEYEDNDDESFQVQQPLNNRLQQKAMSKASKSESHQSKPVLMNSSSNLNVVNPGRHQKTQNFSSPLKNSTNSPKPNNLSMHHHAFGYEVDPKDDKIDLWGHLLIGLSYFLLVFSFPFSLCACVKVAQEYERAVIFRLGRILQGGAKGPGIFFVLPCIDTYIKVDLRTVTFDVPPQEILTRDSVTVSVDAVVYFRIFNAVISVINVEDAAKSTKLLAASTLRNILGTKSLHEILSDRESVAILIQNNLDDATGPWGVKVERVEVKDVRLPVQLQRAMATEAEAAREARAKVIAAEGEQKASKALKEAAEVISESPIAIQLRYLQTLTQIASERNSTIVFPIPLEMLSFLANKSNAVFKKS